MKNSKCLLNIGVLGVFVLFCCLFCTGHFVIIPLNMACLHCLQHCFFEHLFNLYFTDKHYQWNTTFTFTEIIRYCERNVKQIRAPFGPGRISRFINIKEFPSPRSSLES